MPDFPDTYRDNCAVLVPQTTSGPDPTDKRIVNGPKIQRCEGIDLQSRCIVQPSIPPGSHHFSHAKMCSMSPEI